MNRTDGLTWPDGRGTHDGSPRRLGVELEFSGLSARRVAEIFAQRFDGTLDPISEYELLVKTERFGDVRVEVDLELLRDLAREKDEWQRWIADLIAAVSTSVVPVEVVSSPLPPETWQDFDNVLQVLRENGAKGTSASAINAFGLHLNAEVHSLEVSDVVATLQAFLCLYEWLKKRDDVDFSRRLTPFIDPFGHDYEKLVLQPDYQPDMQQFTRDYLKYNPTRNRALDLLPILAFVDEDAVKSRLPDEKNNPRPAYHYRLPNSQIHLEDWSYLDAVDGWMEVEKLAGDHDRRRQVMERRLEFSRRLLDGWDGKWVEETEQWLDR